MNDQKNAFRAILEGLVVTLIILILFGVALQICDNKIDELKKEIIYLKEAKINNATLQEEIRAKAEGIIFETLGINQPQIKFTLIETNVDGFHVYVHMYLVGTDWKKLPENLQKETLTLVSKSFVGIVVKNSNIKAEDVKMNIDLQTTSNGVAAGIYENGNMFIFNN